MNVEGDQLSCYLPMNMYENCKSPACGAIEPGCQQFCVLLLEDAKESGVHGGQRIAHRGFGPCHRGSPVSLQHGGQVVLIRVLLIYVLDIYIYLYVYEYI